jgi:ubiquinone/menaquinone biosynthesis C-methylase UbiE
MEKTDTIEEPNPGKIFETTFAFTTTRVLVAAVDIGLFTHIASGYRTVTDIAKKADASERGIEIILNGLAALDFLTKSNGTYDLTPLSDKFLVKGKPSYFGDFVQHVDGLWEPWSHLTSVTKTGKPFRMIEKDHGPEFFEKMVTQIFPMSYPCARAAALALDVGSGWKNLNVLDIAAGSGAWGIAFAQSDSGTKVTALDLPNVLEVTKKMVTKFDLGERFSYLSGDLREVDFGENRYDLVILGHICHTEGEEKTRVLLSRVHRALKRGGKVLIAEMIADDERKKDVFPLMFAANMLVNSTDGNTFTMAEFREWLNDAGFSGMSIIEAPGPSPLIVAGK